VREVISPCTSRFREALFVIVEQLVSVEAVGERREASARHAGDDADKVEQACLIALRIFDFGIPQELEDAVREGGRARASARKGEGPPCRPCPP